jgi:hypothetical protein
MRFILAIILWLATASAFAQQDFSADIVNLNTTSPFRTTIFATRNKLRFQQEHNGQANSIMLVNLAALTSVVLIPQQHMYVKESKPQIPGQAIAFFQPVDVANACAVWHKMSELKGQCRNLGREAVNGRDTVKYENIAADKSANFIWIDTRLHFPVKWEGPAGTSELRNIQEARQPAELFEIPAGYKKRSFGAPASKAQP